MRVLAIGNLYPPAAAGGYERIWLATMRALRSAGHDVRVLTTAPVPGRPVEGPEPDGPPAFRELGWWWEDFAFPRRGVRERVRLERRNAAVLARHLRWRPDVVSWWGLGGMTLTLVERVRRAGVPSVGVVGDEWMGYGFAVDGWLQSFRGAGRALRPLAERALGVPASVDLRDTHWLFISRWLAERAQAAAGPLPRTGLAHPGVDPARFPPSPAPDWAWRLACIGRVEPRKGVATAVEALARLPAEATLVVDGEVEAGHREELEALAGRHGVRERVTFRRTPADAVAAAYAAADAVLFPVAWDEPWGLVPLEAMAVGRPVVATGTGGSAEYLRDGGNALCVPRGDPGALSAAVRRLAADPPLRARLVEGGRETAARHTAAAFEAAVVEALERAAHN